MSHVIRKPVMWFSTRCDTNWPVQSHKQARGLRLVISDLRRRGIVLSVK